MKAFCAVGWKSIMANAEEYPSTLLFTLAKVVKATCHQDDGKVGTSAGMQCVCSCLFF